MLADGSCIVLNVHNLRKEVQHPNMLWDYWEEKQLEFMVAGENLREAEGLPFQTSYAFADVQSLVPAVRMQTWHRYLLIQPLLALPSRKRTQTVIEERIHTFFTASEEAEKREGQPIQLGLQVDKGRTRDQSSSSLSHRPSKKSPTRRRTTSSSASSNTSKKTRREHPLHPRTVRRWLSRFEQGQDIRSLAPSYHERGPQDRRLSPLQEELLKKALREVYYTEQRASIRQAINKLKELVMQTNTSKLPEEMVTVPSDATLYRYVQDLDAMEVAIARFGRAQAERMHGQVWQGPRPTRPNQRWQFDFAKLDVLIVDGVDWLPIGRPTIAAIRDVYTGYPVGIYISFEPPSYRLVMECLLYACWRKTHVKEMFQTTNEYLAYGIPEMLVVDNGIELHRDLEWACLQLGIELQHTPVRMPWFKGAIERWFRTLNQELIHNAPGTTFSRSCQWKGYDPRKHASMTLDGLWEALHLWIVDDYTQNVHRIGDEKDIPVKRWLRALEKDFTPRLPPSRDDLLVLISRNTTRTVTPHGIEFENLYYQSAALGTLRSRLEKTNDERHEHGEPPKRRETVVQVKYYPGDLGCIWILDPFDKQYIEVRAVNQEYASGLSLWKHRVIKRYARQELLLQLNDELLIVARARLQTRLQQDFRVARKIRTRAGAARFLDIHVSCWMRGVSVDSSVLGGAGVQGREQTSLLSQESESASLPTQKHEELPSAAISLIERAPVPPTLVSGVSLPPETESEKLDSPLPPPSPSSTETVQQEEKRKPKEGKQSTKKPSPTTSSETVVDFSQFGITTSYIPPERVN